MSEHTAHEHYGHDRSARCESCRGVVSIPARSRTFTLDEIMAHHVESCPSIRRVNKENP